MKKEIEVKAKVSNIPALVEKLIEAGAILGETISQDDMAYVNYLGERSYLDFNTDDIFLRIRQSKGKTIFTLKKGEEMNSIEREVEVSDFEQLKDMLEILGFKEAVRVKKVRQKGTYKDFEICLDQVEGLGSFIEVEKITDEDSNKVQDEMFEFLLALGIKRDDRVMNGYDTLMVMKNNL